MSDEKSLNEQAPPEPSWHSDDDAGYSHSDPPDLTVAPPDHHNDLIGEPDALEWANRFCMIHDGKSIANPGDDDSFIRNEFGVGAALPWFAAAIETGRLLGTAQHRGAHLYEVEGSYYSASVPGGQERKSIMIWTIARSNAEARENFMAHCRSLALQGPLFRKAMVRSTGHMPLVIR